MALANMGAGFELWAKDAASPVFGRAGRNFMNMSNKVRAASSGMANGFKQMATAMATFKVGAGMTAGVANAANAAGNFQQGLAGIGVISQATTADLKALHDSALDAALGTKFSPDEAVEGLTNLATAGLTAQEQMSTLVPVLDLATGSLGQVGLADAANAVVGTMKAMGIEMQGYVGEAKNASVVTDKLLKITQMTNFQARDFSTGLSRAATSGNLYKQSLDDTLITMGLLRNQNIEASIASTSLRESFARLATDQRTQQLIQKKGIDVFDKEDGKVRPFIDVMQDLSEKLKGATDAEAFLTTTLGFGRRGMAAYNAVANASRTITVDGTDKTLKGKQAIEAMRFEIARFASEEEKLAAIQKLSTEELRTWAKTAKTSEGAARDFADALLETYAGQKQLLTGATETLKVTIGEGALPIMKLVTKAVYKTTEAIARFINALPPGVRTAIIGVFGAIGSIIASAGALLMLKGILTLLGFSVGGLILSFAKMILVLGPLTLLIGGLGIAFYAMFRGFQKNVGGMGSTWDGFVKKFKLGFKAVTELWSQGSLSSATEKELDKMNSSGLNAFINGFTRFLKRAELFWEGLKTGFDRGVDMLAEPLDRLKKKFFDLIGVDATSMFTGSMSKWEDAGAQTGVALAGLGEIAIDMMSGVMDLAKDIRESLKGVTAADVVEGFRTLVAVMGTLYDVAVFIKDVIMFIVHAIQGLIETVRYMKQVFVESFSAIGKTFSDLFGGKISLGNFGNIMQRRLMNVQTGYVDPVTGKREVSAGSSKLLQARHDKIQAQFQRAGQRAQEARITSDIAQARGGVTSLLGELEEQKYNMAQERAAGQLTSERAGQYEKEFNRIASAIDALAGRPVELVAEIDGEKVMELVHKQNVEATERAME